MDTYIYGQGIWIGMLLGTLVQTIVLLFITVKTDWDKQVCCLLSVCVLCCGWTTAVFADNGINVLNYSEVWTPSPLPICRWWPLKRGWRNGTWKRTEGCRPRGGVLEPVLQPTSSLAFVGCWLTQFYANISTIHHLNIKVSPAFQIVCSSSQAMERHCHCQQQ